MRRLLMFVLMGALLFGAFRTPVAASDGREAANPCLGENILGCTHGLPSAQYQLLLAQMLAHPTPNGRLVEVDQYAIYRHSLYQINRNGITLYNAPNGAPIGSLPPGFIFVGMRQRQDGWAEVRPGQWTPLSELTGVPASRYSGVIVDMPFAYPMAWILQPTKPSSYPGAKPDPNTPFLDRYTRVNIYATVSDGAWDWYLIAPGQWIEQRRVARIAKVEKPEGVKGRWVSVDLFEQVLTAYEDDRMVFTTLISSGRPEWSTNEGLFRIWARFRSDGMSGGAGRADYYQLPAVPYVMYFDNDIGLHGTYWHDSFGYRHSHGCVNLSISDARWLYEWTDNFFADTWVYVWSSGQYR
ncbi:MAG: murein L,D-transpeptidase [Chloroflexi bacterium CFX4]|nr:murein L,D-transpeptidase [Chloroflexi bacterium CFX4]MDL1924019.1 L,D-transpeptidase [Chloroflexi bacterium CFX3]